MSEIEANEVRFGGDLKLSNRPDISDHQRDFNQRNTLSAIVDSLAYAIDTYNSMPDKDYRRLFTGKHLSWELVIKSYE